MDDDEKTTAQLPCEVAALRQRVAELEDRETEHRRAEEQEFRALVENSPDVIARFDIQLRHLYVNPAAERATGIPLQAVIGKTNAELGMPADILPPWQHALQKVFAEGQESFIEFAFPTPRGLRYFQSRIVPEFEKDGSIASALVIARDTTERVQAEEALQKAHTELEQRVQERTTALAKANEALRMEIIERTQAETALRESEERLARILESALDAIITIDHTRQITLFNAAAEKVFCCSAAEAIGQLFDRFLPERFRCVFREYLRASNQSSKARRYRWIPEGFTARRSDGQEFLIEGTISGVDVAGQWLYTIILRDIHERKRAETALHQLQLENIYLQEEIKKTHNFEEIVGTSAALTHVLHDVERVAGTDAAVLITGETGTGKELIARALHTRNTRTDKPLIKVNCAALPAGLIESELFGHEKGAFTGAVSRKVGRFELAHGGTIFLDEIGDLPLELQAKLLKVLQDGEFERVGGTQTFRVNVRVIAATNRDLKKAVEEQTFRADLYYRLNVFPLHLPPLRERTQDIPLLARYFANKYMLKMGKHIAEIDQHTLRRLIAYPWPGNIRELEHMIEQAVILSTGSILTIPDERLPVSVLPSEKADNPLTIEEVERDLIVKTLEKTHWVIEGSKGTAKILNLHPSTLRARMRKLGIRRNRHV